MAYPNIFSKADVENVISRINALQPETQPKWGKMSVDQMLAHCNVTYEMVYTDKHPKPNFLLKFILKSFVKKSVVNEVPYKQNSQTAPQFVMKSSKDFEAEKQRLIGHINQVQAEGTTAFEGRESHSFGKLNAAEWNNMFYKHLDHHLSQFGV
jgi:hypothetical protein